MHAKVCSYECLRAHAKVCSYVSASVHTACRRAQVRAYAVLIASNEQEADRISTALDAGKAYVCTDTAQLASTFERIFAASVAAHS